MTDQQPNQCPGCGNDHNAIDAITRDIDLFHAITGRELNDQGLAFAAIAFIIDPTAAARPDVPADAIPLVSVHGIADPFHLDAAALANLYRAEADRLLENADKFNAIQAELRAEIEKFEAQK